MSEEVVTPPQMTILADHPAESLADSRDLLNLHSRLAVVLDILRHRGTRCPITVAIYGDWGTGKTSAMRWLEAKLRGWNRLSSQARADHPYVYPVWFDPWRFQTRDEVWRGIIAEVILALFQVEALTRESFVPQMIEAAKKFGAFLGKGFLQALAGLDVKIKAGVESTGVEVGIKGEMFRGIYDEFDRAIRPEKAYLNQFEDTLKDWIKSSIKGPPARVALFIDDLDRCSPDVTLEVLEAIKLYLNIESLVFIVALDRNVVEAIVRKHYVDRGLSPEKSKQYLDKMFQVEIQIAPSEQQMEGFLTDQITELDLVTTRYWSNNLAQPDKEVLEKCIRRLAKGNPREIKRLLNSALLRGRAAADNPSLWSTERLQERVFAQGVQFFLLQRIIRDKVSNATRLLLSKNSLKWFEDLSAFVSGHPGILQDQLQRQKSGRSPAEDTSLQKYSQEVESTYGKLVADRPTDDDGKQLDLVALDDEVLWDLLGIPFSMAVAQSAPNLVSPRPFEGELSSADLLRRLRPLLRNRIAQQLGLRVDEITVTDLLQIRDLNLDDSQIDSKDFENVKSLTGLRTLSLRNTIADAGLQHLAKLTDLQTLDLRNAQITDAGLQHLAKLTALQTLDLWGTQITDAGLEHLAKLTALQTLAVGGTQITDAGLEHLAKLTALQTLAISRTQITDAGLEYLAKLSALQSLNLGTTQITDAGLKHLAKHTALKVLNLVNTQITGIGLEHLAKLTSLQTLFLTNTKVSDAGIEHLAKLTFLLTLSLMGTEITDASLEHLAKLTALQTLNLGGTQITGIGLEHLAKLASLQKLILMRTQITDAGLEHLAKLTALQSLDLKSTQITDAGLEHLAEVTALQSLDLSNTQITDVNALKELEALRTLDLTDCRQLSAEAVSQMRAALPETKIAF